METPRLFGAVISIGLLLGIGVDVHAESMSLSGGDWFIHAATSAVDATPALMNAEGPDWIAASVPGNIQADLEAAHKIGPLWYGAGDPRLPSVATKHWWYRKDFLMPAALRGQRLNLVFDGVDYDYEVWLNGKSLGKRSGQFRRSEFDISGLVRTDGPNQLAVSIEPIPPNLEHCWSADLPLSGLGTPDFFVNCYESALRTLHGLKSTSNLAYDWGVNIYTLGIWRDVWVESTGPAAIQWLSVQTSLSAGNSHATVLARIDVDSPVGLVAQATFRVTGPGFDKSVIAEPRLLTAGDNHIEATIPIENPALWWPSGQGSQPLYSIESKLLDVSGRELDRKHDRFGVREIRWAQVEGAPANFVNPYQLLVNGRTIRMMGSDLVPPDLLFGRNGLRAARLLYLAQAAGMNTLRLWGGGVTLPPRFYDLADELGIMLSQEFPLANVTPPSDPEFLANLSQTITDIVKELRNHPSIIEWSGGNEMPWQSSSDDPSLKAMRQVCAANDDRLFRATDPIEGSRHSPWFFIPQASYGIFNGVWKLHSDPTGTQTMDVMRFGEFGAQTPTSFEVFEREIPPASQWPLDNINDPVLSRKNVMQAAFNPLDWLYKPVIEGYFGPLAGPADLVDAGQYIGADALRYYVDELRRKGRKIGDMTSWDFNEPWPNGAGSFLVNYDGQPLMNYYFMKQALAPISLALRFESNLYQPAKGLVADLWLASDAPTPVSGIRWSWTARGRRGDVLGHGTGVASIKPEEAALLRHLVIRPLPASALGPVVIELHAEDQHGDVLTDRIQIFGSDNSAAWPLYGLLHNIGPDSDDRAILPRRPVRVLWIQDPLQGPYDDSAWSLRRFAVSVTYVRATAEDLEKIAPTVAALTHNYDAIVIGAEDPSSSKSMAARLGQVNLHHIAVAVRAGLGIGFEGGWNGFTVESLSGTPLENMLPVQLTSLEGVERRPSAKIVVAQQGNPLTEGQFPTTFPELGEYLALKAKRNAHTVLRTETGDPILLTAQYGKGRVLAFASNLTTNWQNYGGPKGGWAWNLRAWSGYPYFVGRMLTWLSGAADSAVSDIDFQRGDSERLTLPIRRTVVHFGRPAGFQTFPAGDKIALVIENTGRMTALFCSPHPLLEYRPDLSIDNDFVSVPPGESRTITVSAAQSATPQLALSQEGWRVSCWNAAAIETRPDRTVLLSFGRRDSMTHEFAGPDSTPNAPPFSGSRPSSHNIPWVLPRPKSQQPVTDPLDALEFTFSATSEQVARPSWLNINTADQASDYATVIEVDANDRRLTYTLQRGLGIQLKDPSHLAFPETAQFMLPIGTWRVGDNYLKIAVKDGGWFSWDSLTLFTIDGNPQPKP